MPQREDPQVAVTRALGVWAKRNNVRAIDFALKMDWSYNYAWRILKGKDKFSPAAYGTFILKYGMNALKEVFRIADLDPNRAEKKEENDENN